MDVDILQEGNKGDLLDAAVKYCTQELAMQKAAAAASAPSSASHSAISSPDVSQVVFPFYQTVFLYVPF